MPLPFLCQYLPYSPQFLTRKLINRIYLTFSLNLLTFYPWVTLLCMASFHYRKVSDQMHWTYVSMNVKLSNSECSFMWRVFTLISHLCLFLYVFLTIFLSVCMYCLSPYSFVSKSLYLSFCLRLSPCLIASVSVSALRERSFVLREI